MEKLKNCNIILDIEEIENISGSNQYYEITVKTTDQIKYKLCFDYVWEIKCSIENAYLARSAKFQHREELDSSILIIEESEMVKTFKYNSSRTRPMDKLKDYIVFDVVDTVIEILTLDKPILKQL